MGLPAGTTVFTPDGPVTLPSNPAELISLRRPTTPTIFSVNLSTDGTTLTFTVGYTIVAYARFVLNSFNIYFAPTSASNQAALADPATAASAFRNATLVESISAPLTGGTVTFTNDRFLSTDGWFWATAVGSNGNESDPTMPYRAPAYGSLINLSIPPNCSSPAVSKTSPSVDGVTYSLVKASAVVPSDNNGVISVVVTNSGGAYTFPPTVTFSGGLAAGGVAATGSAVLNTLGQVIGVQLATSGQGYVSAPSVVFTAATGSGAAATAYLGTSSAFDGFQLYLTNYLGGGTVEGLFVNAGDAVPGSTIFSQFYMVPDGSHTTTFTFVAVSRAGVRSTSGAPTATLIV